MRDRIQQLKNVGAIKDAKSLSAKAKTLIGKMTDDEFHAIITTHSKIADAKHKKGFADAVQMHGF